MNRQSKQTKIERKKEREKGKKKERYKQKCVVHTYIHNVNMYVPTFTYTIAYKHKQHGALVTLQLYVKKERRLENGHFETQY